MLNFLLRSKEITTLIYVKYAINYLIYIPEYYIHFRSPNKIGLRVLESYLESKIVFRNVTEYDS
jgi:hypothetical protein